MFGAVRVFNKSRQLDAFWRAMSSLAAQDGACRVTDAEAA
jgi:hypothetical protein